MYRAFVPREFARDGSRRCFRHTDRETGADTGERALPKSRSVPLSSVLRHDDAARFGEPGKVSEARELGGEHFAPEREERVTDAPLGLGLRRGRFPDQALFFEVADVAVEIARLEGNTPLRV